MEPSEIGQFPKLQERMSAALDTLLSRALGHLSGLERTVVHQAASMLYPRVQHKVYGASDDQLRSELLYFRDLIDAVIQDEKKQSIT